MLILSSKKDFWYSMPQGAVPLFFIQLVSTLSFSVLYSTLVLYMKNKLGMPVNAANSIMGVFIAFNFALHLLGGFLGGRFLSNRFLFCTGMVAQIIGCLLLSLGDSQLLYYGLGAFLTGSGLNVTCINCMLTQRFAPEDVRRETAFLWSYAGMNIGFFIGFSLSGYFQLSMNYETLFLMSSLGNLMALILCLFSWRQLADISTVYSEKDKKTQRIWSLVGVLGIAFLPYTLSQILHHANWANKIVLVIGFMMLFLILYLAHQQPTKHERNKMFAFAVLMIFGTIFWTLYQTGPMGLTVFIEHNTQRTFTHWIIPPQWFQNINTVAIVVGGPTLGFIFSRMRSRGVLINVPMQFAFALMFIGTAFALLPVGIYNANAQGLVNPSWIVLSFILQSMGELLISPIGYAMIGLLAPARLQGIMMGMWMLNSGVGATLSSYSSNLMIGEQASLSPIMTNPGFSHVFLMLGLFCIGSSVVLFTLVPRLKKLIEGKCVATTLEHEEGFSTHEDVALCE